MRKLSVLKCFLVMIVVSMWSCKPLNDGSELQSLENFAAGSKVNPNACSAAPQDRESILKDPLFEAHIQPLGKVKPNAVSLAKKAATALPSRVRSLFHTLGGRVVVTSDTNDKCMQIVAGMGSRRQFFSEGESFFDSCALLIPETQSDQVFEIFVSDDEKAIQHGLIRQFGLVVAQIFSRVEESRNPMTGQKDYWLSRVRGNDIEVLRNRLVNAFLIDVYEKPNLFDLNSFDVMLGQGAGEKIKQNINLLRQGQQRPILANVLVENGVTLSQQLNLFKDFVFAEAFDSYYCNRWGKYQENEVKNFIVKAKSAELKKKDNIVAKQDNTFLLMRDMFNRTWNVFREVDAIIGQTGLSLSELPKFDETANIKDVKYLRSFSLARNKRGGYGGGGWNPLNWNRWLYTGDPNASDEIYGAATQAAGESVLGKSEKVHAALDVVGTIDPTPITDGLNALGYYAIEGDRKNAAISMAGVFPFVGDAAKAGRLARFAAKNGDEVAEGVVRLRHYTNPSSMKKIKESNAIYGSDNGRVYFTPAKKKPMSPRDAERKLKIDQGKGNAYIDIDVNPSEIEYIKNPLTGVQEATIKEGIDLTGRTPLFKKNR